MASPEDTPDITIVEEDSWAKKANSGILAATGIETAIAVSIYDHGQKLALLGHFMSHTALRGFDKSFSRMRQDATNNFDPQKSHVWIGGGLLIDPNIPAERGHFSPDTARELNAETVSFRLDILQKVRDEMGFGYDDHNMSINWLYKPSSIDYSLDAETGVSTQIVYPRHY